MLLKIITYNNKNLYFENLRYFSFSLSTYPTVNKPASTNYESLQLMPCLARYVIRVSVKIIEDHLHIYSVKR